MALFQSQANRYPNELHVPCTKNGDVNCQLLEHQVAINKVLRDIGLEIRPDRRQVGGVHMAVSQTPVCDEFFSWWPDTWLKASSMNLAHDMIGSHRCFTALEMYSSTPWPKRVQRALKRVSAVKTLTVYLVHHHGYEARFHEGVFALISSLTSLEELTFKTARDRHVGSIKHVYGQLQAQSLMHLTTLDVRNVLLESENTLAFFSALIDNRSVTDFAVDWRLLRGSLTVPAKPGSLCLPRRLAILRKLRLTDRVACWDRDLWLRLTEAFAEKATLEELHVKMKMPVEIYTTVSEGFAQVVLQCTNLQRLQLPTSSREISSKLPEYDDKRWPASLIDALKATHSLRDLYISVAGTGETQLRSLFADVQTNQTLKNVVVWDGLNTYAGSLNIDLLCKLTSVESLGHVVSFGQELFVSNESSLKLVLLSELRSLKFFRLKFRLYYRCTVELLTCCKILCRRGARTIFEVCCVRASEQPDFCDWLAESSELTHVTVAAESHTSADCANMRDRVVTALANNSSIAKLRLIEFKLKTAQLNMLCQNAREHRSLSEFVLTPACAISSQNCNGRSEVFRVALLQLQNVVSQNASRMSAAVKFVLGEDSGDGARAIEELRDHPLLPERVRDDAGLTDAEAQKKVKLAVNRVRNLNVHEFLWLTGVVRERRATPLDPDARGLHILEVPLVCWLYIRRYVNIADVASG